MKKIMVGILMILSVLIIACSSNNQTGANDALAQCLTDKGAVMYGTEWCSHCKTQKEYFGSSFKYVDYVDCDRNRYRCSAAGVKGYPAWQIDGENYPGTQSLERLASLTECQGNLTS